MQLPSRQTRRRAAQALSLFIVLAMVGCGDGTMPSDDPPLTKEAPPMLAPNVAQEISGFVRSGFYGKPELMGIFCEELYTPGELHPEAVSAAIDTAIADWEAEKGTWPAVTDCDRLDSAFAALNQRGVIALQNAGYTQSDGYDDFREAYGEHPNPKSVRGYCFYHGQDLQGAVHGKGLFLAFGPADPKDETTGGTEVGNMVREELERVGLTVEWDGTFDKRIQLPEFVWQRR
jgi:hypothetical protein